MAGVKQFELSEVLDRAMAVFWRRGDEAASIRDLVAATRYLSTNWLDTGFIR
jgi:hypothetical protein